MVAKEAEAKRKRRNQENRVIGLSTGSESAPVPDREARDPCRSTTLAANGRSDLMVVTEEMGEVC